MVVIAYIACSLAPDATHNTVPNGTPVKMKLGYGYVIAEPFFQGRY
jgi:hypothetical protein